MLAVSNSMNFAAFRSHYESSEVENTHFYFLIYFSSFFVNAQIPSLTFLMFRKQKYFSSDCRATIIINNQFQFHSLMSDQFMRFTQFKKKKPNPCLQMNRSTHIKNYSKYLMINYES